MDSIYNNGQVARNDIYSISQVSVKNSESENTWQVNAANAVRHEFSKEDFLVSYQNSLDKE